ncbi:MAG: sn-glycerol-3-phosphate ABC transporter ATP-binding protein UgpC [Xanthomonadales bacterium]|nr:sn-glycerol-3-phosphate ABC transporter ATP-binding protein UgpC [Xanthomonadales bacterium]
MAQVALEQVRKVYPSGHVAIPGASFTVADGERLVLVGPSGCGKSTLLRMIAGLEEISAGTLRIGERVVNEVAPADRDIAMVFQSYALYPHMTVAENMAFALRLRKRPQAEVDARVREAARILELEDLLARKPGQLSGGQRQRVALGRALVRQPEVFLLDEPLSNLDAKLRAGMRAEIARIHARTGTTMIYVTHDQVEAMTLGQRIVVLKDGVVQQVDAPMAMYRNPANLFVATFLGSPAMNTLRGGVQAGEGIRLADGGLLHLPGVALPVDAGEVVVGVRPEHLALADGDAALLQAEVETVEPVGNEVFLNLRVGGEAVVARIPPEQVPEPGTTVGLSLRPGEVLFFDPASGARLPAGPRYTP